MRTRPQMVLEYPKILLQLSRHAISAPGKAALLDLEPQSNYLKIEKMLRQTQSAIETCEKFGGNPMEAFDDVRDIFQSAIAQKTLSLKELLCVRSFLRAERVMKDRLNEYASNEELLDIVQFLQPQRRLEEAIETSILGEEEIADHASPDLQRIRVKLRSINEKIRQRLRETIQKYRSMLTDEIITMRNGRYVIPVRAESVGSISGIVHDRSNSGATVFVEPLAVLEINNELRDLELMERAEIENILREFTAQVAQIAPEQILCLDQMIALDVIFARARYAQSENAVCPILKEGSIQIIEARHPLIEQKRVVPITVSLSKQQQCLVITGPNTGGKTVTLKTIGLFCCMAQSGMFLPCKSAEIPIFQNIFVDIGDEQSIEQSLSTFSSHMTQIIDILQCATDADLVLLDELGSGTDPAEGAALAIAILKCLHEKGIMCACTTHYSEVKSFAMTEKGFINAGMEFDVKTLQPTYRLLLGHAGNSNAFAICQRLGMPETVIQSARMQMTESEKRFERAILKAEALQKEAERARDDAQIEVEKIRKDAQDALQVLRQEALQQKEEAQKLLQKAREELEEAQMMAQSAIETAQNAAREDRRKEREQALQHARIAVKEVSQAKNALHVNGEQHGKRVDKKDIIPGEKFYVKSFDLPAVVEKYPDTKGMVEMRAGIMKITVPMEDLCMLKASETQGKKRRPQNSPTRSKLPHADTVAQELDLRGKNVEEACLEIDQYIDHVIRAGLHEVSIIHGKGTGALRTGVREYLRRHPRVKSFRAGLYGEGEDGVTVITV